MKYNRLMKISAIALTLVALVACTPKTLAQTTSVGQTGPAVVENVISVASYNMLRLGANKKDYVTLAAVIKNFDVVGAIEVMKEDGMKAVMPNLPGWSYAISEHSVGTKIYKEFYGFFYNDRIELVKLLGFYPGEGFMRAPYGAQFKVKDSDFTFNLIIAHIVFGDSAKDRIAEINNLGKVYEYFESITGNKQITMIAGDFNFENIAEFDELIDMGSTEISPVKKSTLGEKGPVSDYDHMFVSNNLKQYIVESDVLYWTDDWQGTRKTVSDHFPVYVKLKF